MEQDQTPSEKPGHPPTQAILHELRTAENSAAHLLPKLQSMKASNPHLTLLDVGAGSGTISVCFAKLIPDGHVTGVDLNPNILPRARAVAEMAGVKNIEFQQGNVYKLPFADETFDVTFCHQVLIHIGTPWDALREMLRVTKARRHRCGPRGRLRDGVRLARTSRAVQVPQAHGWPYECRRWHSNCRPTAAFLGTQGWYRAEPDYAQL